MTGFINSFLSYGLVVIVFMIIIVAAVLIGKKLRENKDLKDASLNKEADK